MNKLSTVICSAVFAVMFAACSGHKEQSYIIETEIPERAEGQTDMVGFAAEPIDTVRVGIIGLGMRGISAVDRFTYIPEAKVVAVCDIDSDKVARAQRLLQNRTGAQAAEYYGSEDAWRQLVERDDLDLVYIVTDWKTHALMGKYAMEQGKHTAIEVPAAMSLDEIWDLVDTSEKTRKHCMMLENCVYDFFELNTLNMAQQGLFGDILHAEGSYIHNLDEYWDRYWNNWRLDYNSGHRGDIYPTHGFGPACQLLDIHRGDRINTLVAMDTKAVTGPELVKKATGSYPESFENGDHTMTIMRTENGKTIHLQHDVMNPRPYNRMYQLTGTKGFANKYGREGYAFTPEQLDSTFIPDFNTVSPHDWLSAEQQQALTDHYTHPIITEVGEVAKKVGGHGGMDFIMDYRLIYCLHNGLPLDMDVYDLAEWCAPGPLGAISIANGSAAVAFPDFTRGAWNKTQGYRHAYKN